MQWKMELFTSSWHVISALLILLSGVAVAKAISKPFHASSRRTLLLYGWHTLFCVVYAIYTQTHDADAPGYFRAALAGDVAFSLGPAAVELVTSFCVSVLGLSYLGTFLFFNILGFIGLIAFDASLRQATAGKTLTLRRYATLIVLLPSVSYWSSAIGKDAIAFMATGLALWAALQPGKRAWLMATAIVLMLLVRPHIAGMMVLALAGSQLLQRNIPLSRRFVLGVVATLAALVMVPLALNYTVGSDASAEELAAYIEQRQLENTEGGSSVDIAAMGLPMQLFTYLFRPLPVEANSLFSLASSLDNVILLVLFAACLGKILRRRRRALDGNRVFLWLFSIFTWILLATTTANLGIAVRQKWMFAPMLIFLLLSLLGKPRATRNPGIRY